MKTLISLVFAATLAMAFPAARAADLTGTWQGAFDLHGTSVPLTLHLLANGDTLTGTIEGLPTSPTEIRDGKVEGSKISFSATTDYQGQTYTVDFTGQLSAAKDEISFTMATVDGSWSSQLVAHRGAETAQATRAPAAPPTPAALTDISGTWKGSFDFQGTAVPVTFHFTASGSSVTGTVQGMMEGASDKPLDIHNGKLDGDTLTFWLITPYQGETYKIVYSGKVANGKIDFTFGTDDGSWSSNFTATR